MKTPMAKPQTTSGFWPQGNHWQLQHAVDFPQSGALMSWTTEHKPRIFDGSKKDSDLREILFALPIHMYIIYFINTY